MKSIYLTLISCFCFNTSFFSQEKIENSSNFNYNELTGLINKHYLKFSTGQESTSSSSYASLDLKETEFTFSPIYITKNSNVWNVKFKGGITDGIASLFNNNKFNTNIIVDIQYNLNLTNNGNIKIIGYYEEDYVKFRKDKIDCLKKNLDELKVYISQNGVLQQKGYENRIDLTLKKVPDNDLSDNLKTNEEILLNLYNQLDEEINNLSELSELQKELVLDKFSIWNNKIADINRKRSSEFKYTRFTSEWLTFGVNARNDEFRLFNRAELFENQIEKTNNVSMGGKIQYNKYNYQKNGNSLFYSWGLNFKRKSNFTSLKKIDIIEIVTIGTNGEEIRNSNDKFIAYEGEYKENLNQLDFNTDFFYFINKFQNIGIHIYETSKFLDFVKPSHDLGFGIVFPFKKNAKETTIINTELYYTIKNIFTTKNTTFGLLERNDIGFRFVFPIDFN